MSSIIKKLTARMTSAQTCLCVGLDPVQEKLPTQYKDGAQSLTRFCMNIVDQTAEYAAAFKINTAFFEATGAQGWQEMADICAYIQEKYPDHFLIADAKRADIGSTNEGYVKAFYDVLGVDAITLHPYLGQQALQPFLDRTDKASIILCRTSNPGSAEFQSHTNAQGRPLWQIVAEAVGATWNKHQNCMLVLGATYPEDLSAARSLLPSMIFLVPGVGTQGGSIEEVLETGLDARGGGLLINSSREILYHQSPAHKAKELRDQAQWFLVKRAASAASE